MLLMLWACGSSSEEEPKDENVPTSGTFSALTYNVAGLPDAISNPSRPGADRMADIAPLAEDFDVVGFQEDFDDGNHQVLVDGMSHPIEERFAALFNDERFYGSGLAVSSRVGERGDYFEEHYAECNGVIDGSSDCLASKGFQVLRLSLGGAELDVYNTHHEAGGGDDDNAARMSQVEQVLASLDGRSDGRAILFMGDTNLRWTDPEDVPHLQAYEDAGLLDACTELDCPETDHIDRFYFRNSDELELTVTEWAREEAFVDTDGEDLSDHPAISAVFDWSTE